MILDVDNNQFVVDNHFSQLVVDFSLSLNKLLQSTAETG